MSESTPPVPDGHKLCTDGKHIKPLSEFIEKKLGTGRYHGKCRECWRAYYAKRYRENPDVRAKAKADGYERRKLNPTYHKDYHQAHKERANAARREYSRLHPVDPEYQRNRVRAYREANRVRVRAVQRAYYAASTDASREDKRRRRARRRARQRGLPFELYTLAQIIERDGSCCVLCGDEIDLTAVWPDLRSSTTEHLECISWPGSAGDVLSNVALSHWDCNNRRQNRPHPAAARKRAELLAAEQSSEP